MFNIRLHIKRAINLLKHEYTTNFSLLWIELWYSKLHDSCAYFIFIFMFHPFAPTPRDYFFFLMFCQIFCIFIVDDVRRRSGRMNWKINFQKQKLTRFGWLREICRGFKYKSFYSCREQSQRHSFFPQILMHFSWIYAIALIILSLEIQWKRNEPVLHVL